MKAKLVSPVSSPPEWEIDLEQFPVLIGRSLDAEILPADPSVSQRHCEIDAINGRLMVRDLGSESGTFVNGVLVDIAPLLPGDELTIGKSSFVASYDLPPPETRKATPVQGQNSVRPALDFDADPPHVAFFNLVRLLERQRELFREHYRREVWREESMFPDPPHPEHVEHLLVEQMKSAGVDPQFIYAFEKTGVLVTEFNYDSVSKHKLDEWQAAIEEYEDRFGGWADDQRYPIGGITMYGPDKWITTMIVAVVMTEQDAKPVYQRWVGSAVKTDPQVKEEIAAFFLAHGVRSVFSVSENVGCPHQEGLDYRAGEDCPFCPYWRGKQRDAP